MRWRKFTLFRGKFIQDTILKILSKLSYVVLRTYMAKHSGFLFVRCGIGILTKYDLHVLQGSVYHYSGEMGTLYYNCVHPQGYEYHVPITENRSFLTKLFEK